jgi:hypothetical protein
MLQYQAQQIIMTEKTKVADNFNKLQAKKTELSRHPQFASIDQEVSNVLSQHVTYTDVDYENLFYYTIGKKSLELNKDSAKVAEKKAIADIQSRSRRKNISGSDGGDDIETMPSKVLTKEGLEMSKAFKTDVKKVAAYVQATKRKGK